MGVLVEGKWLDHWYDTKESHGRFVRPDAVFRGGTLSTDGSGPHPAEPGRYHLFLAPNCPWAHRTQIFCRLKGLEDVISISLADLPRKRSWAYSRGIGRDLEVVFGGTTAAGTISVTPSQKITATSRIQVNFNIKEQP